MEHLKKLLWFSLRVGLLLHTWHNLSLYNTTGQGTKTFARMSVNLELSVNGKFVAYGKMAKIL